MKKSLVKKIAALSIGVFLCPMFGYKTFAATLTSEMKKAYKEKIEELDLTDTRFWVGDINKDGIDDLIVNVGWQNNMTKTNIFTFKNGKIEKLYEDESYNKSMYTNYTSIDGKMTYLGTIEGGTYIEYGDAELKDGKLNFNVRNKYPFKGEVPEEIKNSVKIYGNLKDGELGPLADDKKESSNTEKKSNSESTATKAEEKKEVVKENIDKATSKNNSITTIPGKIEKEPNKVQKVLNEIIKNDSAYADFTVNKAYDSSKVSIKPGSQMEGKWKAEIDKHVSKGSTFSYVSDENVAIRFVDENSGNATYTSVFKGLTTGKTYKNICYARFVIENGKVVFVEEVENFPINVELVENIIINNDKIYSILTQNGGYKRNGLSIQEGSQMEEKWITEITKHVNNGRSYKFIEDANVVVNYISPYEGFAEYTSVLQGIENGTTYKNRCYAHFVIINGLPVFTHEFEDENEFINEFKNYLSVNVGTATETKSEGTTEKNKNTGSTIADGKYSTSIGPREEYDKLNNKPKTCIFSISKDGDNLTLVGSFVDANSGSVFDEGTYTLPLNLDSNGVTNLNSALEHPNCQGFFFTVSGGEITSLGMAGGDIRVFDMKH